MPAVRNLVIFLYKGKIGSISEGPPGRALVGRGSTFPLEKGGHCQTPYDTCSPGTQKTKS